MIPNHAILQYRISGFTVKLFRTLIWLPLTTLVLSGADELPACLPKDFHYEFTECDLHGGRWRVSVPTPNTCVGGAPNPPIRVNDCRISCEAGTYFNRTALECMPCPPGTYSLGGGVKFDSWNTLPTGFHSYVESFESSFHVLQANFSSGNYNCSQYGWKAQSSFIASYGGPCVSTLTYSVKLVKPGALTYSYQYSDSNIIFNFEAQNDQCQTIEDVERYKWPKITAEENWKTMTVQLKAGLNVLYWKTVGMAFMDESERKPKPVRIKSIEISGVAYTSECSPCEPGTYSSKGSKLCTLCPQNSYSEKESSDCTRCDEFSQYAPKGSESCLDRPPCTVKDYYEEHTPCDSQKETQMMYKWIYPQICRDDVPLSVTLPLPTEKKACPPCNPGMEYANKTICAFCPRDYFSEDSQPCQPCPASTAPNYGLFYKWWHEMPPFMYSRCMSLDEESCTSVFAWQPSGDHIKTVFGQGVHAFLVLSLDVSGFRGKETFVNGEPAEIGRVSFTFELLCSKGCSFTFMMSSSRKAVADIQIWSGPQAKQHFSYIVTQNDTYTFRWAFQKLGYGENGTSTSNFQKDMAKIYDITVVNTINGGAASCQSCPQGTENEGCIPCPPGHYLQDADNLKCVPCPLNTYIWQTTPYGIESCKSCGPGLRSEDGQRCYSDCHVHLSNGEEFDLSTLPRHVEVRGKHLFTSSGTQYFHIFNISLCGQKDKSMATCRNNVTYQSVDAQQEEIITSMICRATVVPSQGTNLEPLVTQSVSLGDSLIAITTKTRIGNISVVDEFIKSAEGHSDIHFFYSSPEKTQACKSGRSTVITLRCDSRAEGNGEIIPPLSCADATCDGCNFQFLWKTHLACRICSDIDYQVVKGECIHGVQTLHYISPKGCIPRGGGDYPLTRSITCSIIPQELQVVIAVCVGLGILLFFLVLYFWKKNRKLEYKYMKLVQSSSSKDDELPAAESCAIDEDDDEQFDSVAFSDKKRSLLGNFHVGNKVYNKWEPESEGTWTPTN